MSKYPKLDEYVKAEKLKGKTDDQLRAEMKSAGYTQEDIDSIIPLASSVPSTPSTPSAPSVASAPSVPNTATAPNIQNTTGKNKIKQKLLMGLIVLVVLGGSFYVWKSGLFASAPYNQDNLFSGLAQKIAEMETYSYSVEGSFIGEERDSDAEPFVPTGNSLALKEAYQRDYQRINFFRDFVRTHQFSKPYPQSLSTTAGKLDARDPSTGTVYPYKLTEGGNNFEMSITFETRHMIGILREYRGSYFSDSEPIVINGNTAILDDSASYVYASSRPPQSFYESLNETLDVIPEEIDIRAFMDFSSNFTNDKTDFMVDLGAEGDLGDITYKVDANMIKKDDDFYLRINNLPSLFLMFMPVPKGEWVLLPGDDLLPEFISGDDSVADESYKEEIKSFYREVLILADKNNLAHITNRPSRENINGTSAYKYELQVNKDNLGSFLDDVISELENGNYEHASESLVDLQNFREYVRSEEFVSVLDYYNKNTRNTLWVNKEGYIVKFESANRFVPTSERLSDTQFKLTLSLSLKDINQEVDIEAPSDFKTIEEIEDAMYGGPVDSARDKGTDAMIKANLNPIRAQAELAYDSLNGYGTVAFPLGACSAKSGTLFAETEIYDILMRATEDQIQKATCHSGVSGGRVASYAVSVPLVSDPDYSYCVDSDGSTREILGSLSGASCR